MDFIDGASYFNEDQILDAYDGRLLFYGHTLPHDDHTSSGATARRRTLVAAVDAEMPPRRAISWYGSAWIVGNANDDSFQGQQVRRSFGLKKSTGVMTLVTPGEACLSAPGLGFHAQRDYYRDMTDGLTSADYDVMWNVFCPLTEPVTKGAFLRQAGVYYRVREVYDTVDEYRVAEADQFDTDAAQMATFVTQGVVDLVTEQASTVSITAPVLQTDSQKFYTFRTEAESTYRPGDRTVFVAKSSFTPKPGTEFSMMGETWRAITVVSEKDAWAIRARLA